MLYFRFSLKVFKNPEACKEINRIEEQALVCTDSESGGSRECVAPAEPVSRVLFEVRLPDLTLLCTAEGGIA